MTPTISSAPTSYTTKNTSYVITEPRTVGQTFYWHVRGGLRRDLFRLVADTVVPVRLADQARRCVYPPRTQPTSPTSTSTGTPCSARRRTSSRSARTATGPTTGRSTYGQEHPLRPADPLNNGNYYWRVRAIDAASPRTSGHGRTPRASTGDERVFQRGCGRRSHARRSRRHGHPDVPHVDLDAGEARLVVPAPDRDNPQISDEIGNAWGCLTNRTTWTPYLSSVGTSLKVPGSCTTPTLIAGHTYYWDVAGLDNPVLNPSAVDLWGPPAQASSIAACGRTCARSSGSRIPARRLGPAAESR